jgi:hypothetical protein
MQRKVLAVIVAALVAALAIAAVAFGPAGLRNLSNPGANPNTPGAGPGPQPTAFDAPTWHTGDSWTYEVNSSSRSLQTDGPAASGHLTRTVVSATSTQYNVSFEGSFHIRWMVEPTPLADASGAPAMAMCQAMLENATVSGYSWYRASDLALQKEVRTLSVHGSSTTNAGVYDASYSATVETTFDPALNVWSFPLKANESWTATSNATVRGWVLWQLSGPNATWKDVANFTYTEPVKLFLMSGEVVEVSTPAGTFSSIPVSMGRPELDMTHAGIAADPGDRAMGLDHELPVERNHAMQAWFSGTAKNVVKSQMFAAGMRLNLVLSSYHLG